MNKSRINKKSMIAFLKQITIPVLFMLFAVGCVFFHISDVDFGYHLRTAEIMVKDHYYPTVNTFSYVVPDYPWLLHQGYGTIPWYWAYVWGGVTGLVIFKVCIVLFILTAIYLTLRLFLSRNNIILWLILTLIILMIRPRLFERPYLFSALFFSWVQYFLYLSRIRQNHLWLVPVPFIFSLWVNVHAGFLYGFLILGAFGGGSIINNIFKKYYNPELISERDSFTQIWKLWFYIFVSCVLSIISISLVNPFGLKVVINPSKVFTDSFYKNMILELNPSVLRINSLFYGSICFLIILFIVRRRKINPIMILISAGMGYLAICSTRMVLLYGLSIAPVFGQLLSGIEEEVFTTKQKQLKSSFFLKPGLIFFWIVIFIFQILPSKTLLYSIGLNPVYYPMEIFDFIKEKKPQGRIFHELQHGGPILWYLYPEYKVYCDGRLEAYDKKFWKQKYFPVLMGKPGWEEQLARHDVKMVLLYYSHDDTLFLGHILQDRKDWIPVIFDDNNILYLKVDKANAELVAKFGYKHLKPIGSYTGFITKENAAEVEQEALRAINSITNKADHRARVFLARALLIQEKYKQASEVYQALYTFNPKDDFIIRDLAYALFRLNKYNQAEQLYKILANRDRYQAYAWYMLSFTAVQTRDLTIALQWAQKAVSAEPRNLKYQQRLNNLKKRLR